MLRTANSPLDFIGSDGRRIVSIRMAYFSAIKKPSFSTEFYIGGSFTWLDPESYLVDLSDGDFEEIKFNESVENQEYGTQLEPSLVLVFPTDRTRHEIKAWFIQKLAMQKIAFELVDECGDVSVYGPVKLDLAINSSNAQGGVLDVQLKCMRSQTFPKSLEVDFDDFLSPVKVNSAAPPAGPTARRLITTVSCIIS